MKLKHHIFYRALSCFLLTTLLLSGMIPYVFSPAGIALSGILSSTDSSSKIDLAEIDSSIIGSSTIGSSTIGSPGIDISTIHSPEIGSPAIDSSAIDFSGSASSGSFLNDIHFPGSMVAWAEEGNEEGDEEGDEEEEYIPEEYYEPIQSNDIPGWPQGQAIQAAAGVVLDMDTGAFLYSKNCDRQLYPASITKIMTCLLVLENADLDAVMTCSPIVYELDENASNTGLSEGEQMTIRDALYTLMLESANDTANALAEHVGGSLAGFAQMMNDKAASLGCTGTHFSNPSGLHGDDHYTTAHDMALIAQAAYANETFRTICGTVEAEVAPTNMYEETRYLLNHHQMLRKDTDYYTSWCTGGKTGFTQMAWNTLVTYGEKDGKRLICVLLHGNGAGQNYLETIDLLNYGFNNFQHVYMNEGPEDKSLASLMKVQYLGKAAPLEAAELSQVASHTGGVRMVSIPNDATVADVVRSSGSAPAAPGESAVIPYLYHDWPVGSMTLGVNPVTLNLTYPWQKKVLVRAEGETGDKEGSIKDTSDIVWQDVGNFANRNVEKIRGFIEENRKVLILIVGLIVIVLLLIVLMLLLRSTRDYRSRKKMRQAREEALRLEEEIDAKSTEEIEEELRRAMAMEEEERTRDDWKDDPGLKDLNLPDSNEDR